MPLVIGTIVVVSIATAAIAIAGYVVDRSTARRERRG
jgi:hypothetical protein